MAADDYAYLFKVVFIGKESVGKTCLVKRFTHGTFNNGQNATIGVDFFIKSVTVGGECVKLQLWDTAGQERFRCITQTYYRSANAVILVYDISQKASFDCLPSWLQDVQAFGSQDAILCLVGNKSDLAAEREVSSEAGAKYAGDNNMIFIETSAKDATNVMELIEVVARKLVAAETSRIAGASDSATTLDGRNISGTESVGFSSSTTYDRVRQASSDIIRGMQLGAKQVRSSVIGGDLGQQSFVQKATSSCCSQ